MSEEWGPWIEHDGKGCPVVGKYVQDECETYWGEPFTTEGIVEPRDVLEWDWENFGRKWPNGDVSGRILRYRIRKPRGLTILEEQLRDLPVEVDA